MTSTAAALLAAVAARPADDLPRLVYADYLDDHGDPLRAEFIRIQVEIARKETLPRAAVNAFAHLWQRQQEILDGHLLEVLGPQFEIVLRQVDPKVDLGPYLSPRDFVFRRGFLSEVTMPARWYTGVSHLVTGLVPLPERIRVTEAGGENSWPFFSNAPALDFVTHLSLPLKQDDDSVTVGLNDPAGIRTCRPWPRLLSLDLENCHLGDAGVRELFAPPAFPALADLDLSFNHLTDSGVIDLLNTGLPQRLRRLVLGGNPLGDQAALELADRLGRSPVLENLNLRMTNIGPAGQAALFRAFPGGRVDLF